MTSDIRIGDRMIGGDRPTYFIADIAANHDGNLERAKALIHLCAEAGADAAKFQNFEARSIVSDAGFRQLGSMAHQARWSKSVFEVYEDATLDLEWTETLRQTCIEAGVEYLTTPYAFDLADRLAPYVRAWKIGSGDITWISFIERLARDGKPLLIATGASDMMDVERAVSAARQYNEQIVLMQCNTNYTADPENLRHVSLNVLKTYAARFPGLVLGLSDHTPGHATVLGAVALGARVVEKHFTDDVNRSGPDHAFSMDPRTWREMMDRTRELQAALGTAEKRVMDNEIESVVVQRRALRAARAIPEGTVLSEADVVPLRPCPSHGLAPYAIDQVLGRRVRRPVALGELLTPALFE